MRIIAVVFGECNTILFALFMNDGEKDYRTRITGSTGSLKVERWKGEMVERCPRYKLYQAIYCVIPGVAKSVCHRDRRSLPNRQLRCLCRTDFGSPARNRPQKTQIRGNLRLLYADICENHVTRDPVFMGMSMKRYKGAMNTWQNDLSVNPCNPFHPYDAWHANLIRIDGFN